MYAFMHTHTEPTEPIYVLFIDMCPGLTTWDWTKPLLKAATDEVKQPFENRAAVFPEFWVNV